MSHRIPDKVWAYIVKVCFWIGYLFIISSTTYAALYLFLTGVGKLLALVGAN